MLGKALSLLSAGLDSSIAMELAQAQGWEISLALTFDYGQRSAQRELAQAAQIASFYKVPHKSMSLPWFREFSRGGGLLSTNSELPKPTYAELGSAEFTEKSKKAVWVPNRNGVFIEVAASIAEERGFDAIIVGFNREEAATFPDNSVDYLNAINHALSFSTSGQIRVISPTAAFSKSEIVERAAERQFPFPLLWSCYESHALMCGACESCMRLKRAMHSSRIAWKGYFENSHLG